MKNQTTTTATQTYNGWANYETWNVSLWMQNNMFFYNTAIACVEYVSDNETPYQKFIRNMTNCEQFTTRDGVSWDSKLINHDEINEMMIDMHKEENWMKKYIFQHCNSDHIKTIIARSEYKAIRQNFGNLAGYKLTQILPIN